MNILKYYSLCHLNNHNWHQVNQSITWINMVILICCLPDKKMCSRSQAGILTNEESDTLLQPLTSSKRSLWELFKIRCRASSSINGCDASPSKTPATLNSSSCGNPWEAAYTTCNVIYYFLYLNLLNVVFFQVIHTFTITYPKCFIIYHQCPTLLHYPNYWYY